MRSTESVENPAGVMKRLRDETRSLHDAAEQNLLQRSLSKGQLDLSLYIAYLQQLLLVHQALEGALREFRSHHQAVLSIVEDHQFQEPNLRADLKHLGASPDDQTPLESTAELVSEIERDAQSAPIALLGYHYVLHGSTNGGRFIARNVRVAYGLEGDAGVRYLDPYGEDQRSRWKAFKDAMSHAKFTPSDADMMAERAKTMFAAIAAIGDELLARSQERSRVVS